MSVRVRATVRIRVRVRVRVRVSVRVRARVRVRVRVRVGLHASDRSDGGLAERRLEGRCLGGAHRFPVE